MKLFPNYRLWVLDSGVINDKPVCQAQLVIFDLSRAGYPRLLIHKFDKVLSKPMSLFIAPVRQIFWMFFERNIFNFFNLILKDCRCSQWLRFNGVHSRCNWLWNYCV